MKHLLKYLVFTIVTLALLSSAAAVLAAPGDNGGPGGGGRGRGGEVTAINGATLTVENPRGEATIVTDENTVFTVNDEAGSLGDVSVGMFVRARGETAEDGTFTATQLFASDEQPERPTDGEGRRGRGAGGEVTAIDGLTLTVENPRGTATIVTTTETTFTVNGEAGSLSDITVGMFVRARGEKAEDGTVTATDVFASDEAPERPTDGEGRPGPGGGPGPNDQA